jgi:hypothetical protein
MTATVRVTVLVLMHMLAVIIVPMQVIVRVDPMARMSGFVTVAVPRRAR